MRHTSEPWAVVDPASGGWAVQFKFMTTESKNGGFVVAMCPGPDGEANANAIAAMPEMLAALVLCADAMTPACNREERAALGAVNAAIAKAKGAKS